MSPTENELRSTLQRDADHIDATGDFAAAAIGIERHRRRRRTAITAAAAALVAAVVPFLVWSPGGPTGSLAPATNPTASASPTATPTPSATGSTTPSTPSATATTATPSPANAENTYALDDTIVVDGRVIKLERGTRIGRFSVLSNGGFVLESQMGDNPSEIEILSPTGKTVRSVSTRGGSYAMSRDGTVVAAETKFQGPVVVLSADGTELTRRPASTPPAAPVAVVGEFVYLAGQQAEHTTEWNYVTGETRDLPRFVTAVSEDRGLAALDWPAPNQDGYDNCWAVVDLTKADFPTLIERCAPKDNPGLFKPREFSSNGTYLVGEKYIDGGFWFIPAVYRVSDGQDMLPGTRQQPVSGWSWRLTDDESSIVISRNSVADPYRDAPRNTLQRCSLDLVCTEIAPQLPIVSDVVVDARYVVPR